MKITNFPRVVSMVISNLQSDALISRVKVSNMPQKISMMSSVGHGATITMHTRLVNLHFLLTRLCIEVTLSGLHLAESKIKSIEGLGTRINTITAHLKKVSIGTGRRQIQKTG
jgi:hypothetical protein